MSATFQDGDYITIIYAKLLVGMVSWQDLKNVRMEISFLMMDVMLANILVLKGVLIVMKGNVYFVQRDGLIYLALINVFLQTIMV